MRMVNESLWLTDDNYIVFCKELESVVSRSYLLQVAYSYTCRITLFCS